MIKMPLSPSQQRRACYFSGRVQGVGFRYTVANLALQYDVHGYVRNLADGRVEVMCEGQPKEIDSFVASIEQKMNGYIRTMETDIQAANGEWEHFFVRH